MSWAASEHAALRLVQRAQCPLSCCHRSCSPFSVLHPLSTGTATFQSFSLSLAVFQLVQVCKEGKGQGTNGRVGEGLVLI